MQFKDPTISYHDLLLLIHHIPEPLIVSSWDSDQNQQIVAVNKAAIELTGYSRYELLDMDPFDLVDPDLLRHISLDKQAFFKSKFDRFESVQIKKNGEKYPVSVALKLVETDENRKYIINIFSDITDKKNTEVLLEKTHQEFESLFDFNPDLIFTLNKKGHFTNVNPANERILHFTKQELLDKSYHDIIYEEDLSLCNSLFQEVITNNAVQKELRVYTKEKDILILDITAVPTFKKDKITGVIGVARDITKEKEIAKQLQESEQRYRSLFENNIDPVLTLDLQGHFIYMNKVTEDLMGYSKQELVGTSFLPHIVPELREYTKNQYAKVQEGEAVQYETCLHNKQKDRVYIHVTVIPIIVDGHLTGVHCLAKDITEKKHLEDKLNYLAYHDYLTTLPNQHFFHNQLKNMIDNAESTADFSIFFLDLDRFKTINDSLGHEYGDILLKKVAKRLQRNVPANATVFRYGGDEFIVLLENTTIEETEQVATNILKELIVSYHLDGIDIVVSPSIGISVYPSDATDAKTLIKKADNAMYHAKRIGKSNFQFYHDSMVSKIHGNVEMESLLRKAIALEEFLLVYQPQIDAVTNKVYGAEALIRWNNKELGMISPGQFIPLAEDSGLIVPIGEWVIREACQQVKQWQEEGHPLFPISVNLSIRQFYQTDLIPVVQNIIEEIGIEPEYLELEITESMAMDADTASTVLHELKEIGVKIAIDDFGTGYSSLSYLKQFPIDHLKIDQSFIQDISDNGDDEDIVSAIITLAHNLKMATIAEGVETEAHIKFLQKHQCDVLQGYYFSKPLEPQAFKVWLQAYDKNTN
ncbi:EAL domain-containing protein [Gracilibacillus salitolerans]|uniref:EAL domain-containing protein n=1 Tax=Gracilibacillus salitolerans TaxID=2663022 RepID=A0A5Q2TGU9_9BACI|nr:bifunctional diguanylate cyclase/phosphodiesterase [Gracilibacillus salitolerans]QGH33361.1 EAL domain-containing protein [Gracilibacillus salitolerans]